LKTERLSYPVITGSSARAIVERIYRNNSMTWDVVAVDILNPLRYAALMRNELKSAPPKRKGPELPSPIQIETDRTQRHTNYLRDPAYTLWVRAVIDPQFRAQRTPEQAHSILRRRLARGACRERPCFGAREFIAHFTLATPDDQPDRTITRDVTGYLSDMYYPDRRNPNNAQPVFTDVTIREGRLILPASRRSREYESGAA
jgi:CRISPR-associated protein Cas5d